MTNIFQFVDISMIEKIRIFVKFFFYLQILVDRNKIKLRKFQITKNLSYLFMFGYNLVCNNLVKIEET